ncbi:Mgm101p-domain-containing protein, partial [Leucogyrophana mollusca]
FGSVTDSSATDWSKSHYGLSTQAFSKDIAEILLAPVDEMDVEMKPDGLIYLPEIKYRRVLNKAFGPGAWGLSPRSETNVGRKVVSREYALVAREGKPCLLYDLHAADMQAIAHGEQESSWSLRYPDRLRGLQKQHAYGVLEGLGYRNRTMGPPFHPRVQGKVLR